MSKHTELNKDNYKRGRVIIARDLVINWFSTGDGNGKEETMVRAIAKRFD